jgi:hypothetical protein
MDIHQAFKMGALELAQNQKEYSNLHKGHGIDEYDWEILTQSEYWSPEQARNMRSVIANVVEVSMTIAGMPAIPLPGHYVAALIAIVVAPCNRMVACVKAPDTFDGAVASGIESTHEVKDMSVQQLMALVLAYSGGFGGEPQAHKLSKSTSRQMKEASKK